MHASDHHLATAPLVMLVDDHVDLVHAAAQILEMWGYRTIIAEEPTAALAMASVAEPDVFILDIGMPNMDGYDLGAILKKEHPKATFIGHSAWHRNPKREAETGFAFDGFVNKPLGMRELELLLPALIRAQKNPGSAEASDKLAGGMESA